MLPVTAWAAGWTTARYALFALAFAPLAYYLVALFAARRFFAAPRWVPPSPDFAPPISILKPVYGLDRETYENYASFCAQIYPEYEILFGASDEQDPAVSVIRKLIQDFPDRPIRLLIGSERLGVSDKVNKLCRLAREAKHEILIVSDSDVFVGPDYLRAVVAPFADERIGGVTCLYRGLTDGSLAANLEALGNSTDFAAGVLVAWLFSEVNFMLGATMAVRKTCLDEIGGFESMVDYFSDDYELGNRIAAKGHRVELIPQAVSIVYPHQTMRQAFVHQMRWNLSIRFSRPAGHLGLIFTQGLPLAIIGAICAPSVVWGLGILAAYVVLRTAVAWSIGVAGMRDLNLRRHLELLLPRDIFAFVVWFASFFPRNILWRGKKFQVRDKKLVAIEDHPA
ncbi:MAG TPA: bacteriohopanetetrol glucosamine biosynthesis glycosyltransferase HpnI [Candidatus Acidoferrales bacterium]